MTLSGPGVLFSVCASILFALIPGYVVMLTPLDGFQVLSLIHI